MPLPSSGPISFNDLNLELGNPSETKLDMDSVAIEFSLTRPHGMDEFYGLSLLGDDFLFSDWTGGVSVNEFGIISSTLGNAAARVINTPNFGASTTSQPRSVSVTITVPNSFNGEEPANAGEPLTGNKSTTQSAVGRYLSISADTPTMVGSDNLLELTVTDTYYNDTPWEIDLGTSISNNSLGVVSFLPITGTGDSSVNVSISDNTSGVQRGSKFTVTGTVGGKSNSVDVYQNSYTPVPVPSIYISSVSPSTPYSYDGVGRITFNISRTNASSFSGQISPGIDGNLAIFSPIQPSGITALNDTQISGTGTTFYVEIPSRSDSDETSKDSYLSVSVSTGGGSDSDSYTLSQQGYSLPQYNWGGSVSIDRDTGDVVVSGDDSAGTITLSPISFNEYVTTSTQRTVVVSNIVILVIVSYWYCSFFFDFMFSFSVSFFFLFFFFLKFYFHFLFYCFFFFFFV